MKVLIDMNLAPAWVGYLDDHGIAATHWSAVGDPRAPDEVLMQHALEAGAVLFTHDLDMGTLLALSGASGPSVLQLRTLDITPEVVGSAVVRVLTDHADEFAAGAIVTVDLQKARVRLLPIRKRSNEPA